MLRATLLLPLRQMATLASQHAADELIFEHYMLLAEGLYATHSAYAKDDLICYASAP